jgi:hypothetical protein
VQILSSRIRHHVKRLSIFLITVGLIIGIASCDGGASCGCSPVEWDLNASGGEGGNVVFSGGPRFAWGTVVAIEAVAAECYEFVNWTGADVADPYSPITTVTMDKAKNVTANFALLSYDLTMQSTDGGQVTSPGEDTFTYECDAVVALVAASEEGYYFVNWSGDVGAIANINAPTTTITMRGDYSATANFELIPPEHFVLNTSRTSGGLVTTPGEGTFLYDEDRVVDLVAVADNCYEFVNWTGDTVADPDSATTNITMDGAKSVVANFALLSYDLTIDSTDGGDVTSPSEGTHTYDCNTVVDLAAEADGGYYFVNWTGDVSTVDNVDSPATTIAMQDNYAISANFEQIPPEQFTLTISGTTGGRVADPGEGVFTYDEGTTVNLAAQADEGYQFANWTGDVGTIADVYAVSTTIAINGNYSISVNFEEITGGQIWDWYDLYAIRDNLGGSYVLMNDLDSTTAGYTVLASETANGGKGWQPIGTTGENDRFVGSFNGQGYVICDLFIDRPAESNVGIFGVVDGGGVIANIGLLDATVTGRDSVGGLVGYNSGNVSDSYCIARVTGGWSVGGLVGHNSGSIGNSYCTALVTDGWSVGSLVGWNRGAHSNSNCMGLVTGGWSVGGLVGHNSGNVSDSYCIGRVTGGWSVGGLVGQNSGNVSDSYCTGLVTGGGSVGGLVGQNEGAASNCSSSGSVTGNNNVGGLVGTNEGIVIHSYSTSSVTGNTRVGGLVGQNEGTVSNCSSSGCVTGNNHVGGLIGTNEGNVSDSYSTGSATGNTRVGGLIGQNSDTVNNSYATGRVTGNDCVGGLVGTNEGSVGNSYSTGRVTGNKRVGGLVGRNSGTVSISFWDTQTSGQGSSAGGTAKTTTQMKDIATFSGGGWDIVAVANIGTRNTDYLWNIVDDVAYPFLSWQP